jgi:uncharacterized membrane protein YhaH (DUF805 family)
MRVTRMRYWIWHIILIVPFWGLVLLDYLVSLEGYDHYQRGFENMRPVWLSAFLLYFLTHAVLLLLVSMGRMRDRGREPRLVLLGFALFVIWRAVEGRWDGLEAGEPLWWAMAVPVLVYLAWLLIELGFLPGTSGLNHYGPDPRASPRDRAVPAAPSQDG